MPLQPQRVHIPFSGAINQKIAREVIDGPNLLTVENGRRVKSGRVEKRYGYEELGFEGLSGAGEQLLLRGRELCQITNHEDGTLFRRDVRQGQADANTWIRSDNVPNCQLERIPIHSDWSNADFRCAQVAVNRDLVCVVFENRVDLALWAHVVDRETGTLVAKAGFGFVGSGGVADTRPRVIAVDDAFVLLYVDTANSSELRARTLNALDPIAGWSGEVVLGSDTDFFDATPQQGQGAFVICVVLNGASDVALARYNLSLAQTHATADLGTGGNYSKCAVYFHPETQKVIAAWGDPGNTQIEAIAMDSILTMGTATTGLIVSATDSVQVGTRQQLAIGPRDNSSVWVVWDVINSGGFESTMKWRALDTSAVLDDVTHENGFCSLASTPFRFNTSSYIAVWPMGQTFVGPPGGAFTGKGFEQASVALVDLGNPADLTANSSYRARPVAQWMLGETYVYGESRNERTAFVADVTEANPTEFFGAFLQRDTTFTAMFRSAGVELARVTFGEVRHSWAEALEGLLIASALPSSWDGRVVCEWGFLYYPVIGAISEIAGTVPNATQYWYKVVFEYRDRLGRVARSRPSNVETFTTTGDFSGFRVQVTPYTLTSREDTRMTEDVHVSVVLYRATTAADAAQDNFARIMVGGVTPQFVDNNRLSLSMLQIDDTSTAAPPQTNLYTNGGVLAAQPPPPSRHVTVWQNRFWLVSTEDPKEIWYSMEIVEGDLPWFSGALVMRVDEGGGIVATAGLDASLVIFKRDRMFFVQGTGPNDLGEGATYTEPQSIAGDVGCINAASIVLTPAGLMFQSERGIYLLNRGLALTYIGAPVEDELAAFPTITSACLVRAENEVRFTCKNASGTVGRILTYHLLFEQWFVQRVFAEGEPLEAGIYADTGDGGRHHVLRLNSRVLREAPGVYADTDEGESVAYPLRVVTPHYKMDGLQGFMRLWRATFFGVRLGSCGVTIGHSQRDYAQQYGAVGSWSEAQIAAIADVGTPDDNIVQLPVHLKRQTGQAHSFELSDGGGTTQSNTIGYVGFGVEEDSTLTITAGGTPYVFQYDFDGGGVLPGRIQFGVGASTNEQISQSLAAAIVANAATLPFTAAAVLDAERAALIAEHPEFAGYEGVIIEITADDPGAIVYSAAMSVMAGTLIEVWTVGGTVLAGTAAMAWLGVLLEYGVERGTGRFDAARKR